MTQQDQRYHLRALMERFVDHRADVGYLALRPMANLHFYEGDWVSFFKSGAKHEMDCSEAVTCLSKMSGLKDPTGFGYSGSGNSATMFQHLSHFTNPLHTMTGSIVTFGSGGASHVAMVYQGGQADPVLWSHGTAAGPEFVSLSGFVGNPANHHVDAKGLAGNNLAEFTIFTFCSVGAL